MFLFLTVGREITVYIVEKAHLKRIKIIHQIRPPSPIPSNPFFIFTFILSLYDRATGAASVVEAVVVVAVVIIVVVSSVVIVVVIGSADVVVVNVTIVVASAFKAVDSVSGSADVDCTGWAVVVPIEGLSWEFTVSKPSTLFSVVDV